MSLVLAGLLLLLAAGPQTDRLATPTKAYDERLAAQTAGIDQRPLTQKEIVKHLEQFGVLSLGDFLGFCFFCWYIYILFESIWRIPEKDDWKLLSKGDFEKGVLEGFRSLKNFARPMTRILPSPLKSDESVPKAPDW